MIHGKPLFGNFAVQISIARRGSFQLGSKRFIAPVRHVMLNRLVNEPAALAKLRHPVNGLDCSFRQDDVNAFAHGNKG